MRICTSLMILFNFILTPVQAVSAATSSCPIEFHFVGDWKSGVTRQDFNKAMSRIRMNRPVRYAHEISSSYFTYLDRIVVQKGSTFAVETVQRALPNPEAFIGLAFEAYFYDFVITIPDQASIDELAKHLVGISEWPAIFQEDFKRLPPFFNDRIAAARAGQDSLDYYCDRLLQTADPSTF